MAERGDSVWVVTGDSESGDRRFSTFGHEPSREELLELVRGYGDDAGVAGKVTLADLDEEGYLLDESRWEDPDNGVWCGAGFGGSYVELSVAEQKVR